MLLSGLGASDRIALVRAIERVPGIWTLSYSELRGAKESPIPTWDTEAISGGRAEAYRIGEEKRADLAAALGGADVRLIIKGNADFQPTETRILTSPTGAKKRTTRKVSPASANPGTPPAEDGAGLPWPWILGAVAALGLGWYFLRGRRSGGRGRRARARRRAVVNPSDEERIARAEKFREEFTWGYPAKNVRREKIAPRPRALVKLGDVVELTYRTRKKGEEAQHFTHDFEGRRPTLGMDIDNKRLHFVGGDYTVTGRGIEG